MYLDSEVYFKYNETALPSQQKSSEQIKLNLDLFVTNLNKSGIMTRFKKKQSLETFNQFMEMNYHLLKILQFQTINNEALRKILKKFDKQTSLEFKNFPKIDFQRSYFHEWVFFSSINLLYYSRINH